MKNIKYLLLIAVVFLYSCNDWLDVNPKTEKRADQFFETEDGFRDALMGAYIQMKDVNAYGKKLTMSSIEDLVCFHDRTSGSLGEKLNNHSYDDAVVKAEINSIYYQLYKIISSSNLILSTIDDNKDVFSTEELYTIIKGECLGIRAYCHLDLLRLFGPVPTEATESTILAYVTEVTAEELLHIPFQDYKEKLFADLSEAEELLKGDTISFDNNFNDDYFLRKREFRLNYYAIKALQARANLYVGNKTEAYKAAKLVIDSGKRSLNFTEDLSSGNHTLPSEHLFCLYDFKLEDRYENLFNSSNLYKGDTYSIVASDIYENSASDARTPGISSWWNLSTSSNGTSSVTCEKYSGASTGSDDKNRISLLRLAEMYLIAVETAPTLNEAQEYWEVYRNSRNVGVTDLTDETIISSVMSEYRKEFYVEGQMFYTHKRLNSPGSDIVWFPNDTEAKYILPLPNTELQNN